MSRHATTAAARTLASESAIAVVSTSLPLVCAMNPTARTGARRASTPRSVRWIAVRSCGSAVNVRVRPRKSAALRTWIVVPVGNSATNWLASISVSEGRRANHHAATSGTAHRESSVSPVMVWMHSSQISDSARSISAMIASVEREATAAWIAAALPPLPANAVEGARDASPSKPTAATLRAMFFMVILRVRGWLVDLQLRVVLARVVVHAHVGGEDQQVELLGSEVDTAVRLVVRVRECAHGEVGRREQLRRVQHLDRDRAVRVLGVHVDLEVAADHQ